VTPRVGGGCVIEFLLARRSRVLLIRFNMPVTRETLTRLDAERSALFAREGPMDFIMDFSASSPVEATATLTGARAHLRSPAPNHRRIYVAPQDLLFGALRMYQIPHDDPLVHVTRSMAEALEMLKVSEGDFEPVGRAST